MSAVDAGNPALRSRLPTWSYVVLALLGMIIFRSAAAFIWLMLGCGAAHLRASRDPELIDDREGNSFLGVLCLWTACSTLLMYGTAS